MFDKDFSKPGTIIPNHEYELLTMVYPASIKSEEKGDLHIEPILAWKITNEMVFAVLFDHSSRHIGDSHADGSDCGYRKIGTDTVIMFDRTATTQEFIDHCQWEYDEDRKYKLQQKAGNK